MKTMSKTSSILGSVSNASPSISSAISSSPASARLRPPGLGLQRVGLQREDAPAEVAEAGGEPDRRVAARSSDLQHLAVRLGRDQVEEELPRRPRDLPGAKLPSDTLLALRGVLRLEPLQHRANPVVEHQMSTFTTPSSTTTGNVSTGWYAGRESGRPEQMSNSEPWRGQITTPRVGVVAHPPRAARRRESSGPRSRRACRPGCRRRPRLVRRGRS